MAMLGARPKSRDKGATGSTNIGLPAGRLDQLMTFVEKAATPATPVDAPDLPPRLVPSPRADVLVRPAAQVERAALSGEAVPVTPLSAPSPSLDRPPAAHRSIEFPEPILVMPQQGGGKRRREPLLAS